MPSHRARTEIAVTSLLLLVLLHGPLGCDDGVVAAPSEGDAELVSGEPLRVPAEPVAKPEAQAKPSEARAGEGALALGVVPPPLDTVGVDATIGCEICRFDQGPKLVVLGAIDDPAWHGALQDLDAIASFYGDDGLGAFAVLGERGSEGVRAAGDPAALRGGIDRLREELRLALPMLAAAGGERGFAEYRVGASPTVLLLDGKGVVLWSGIAMKRWGELDAAIVRALGDAAKRTDPVVSDQ
jgi:hypothetical protein